MKKLPWCPQCDENKNKSIHNATMFGEGDKRFMLILSQGGLHLNAIQCKYYGICVSNFVVMIVVFYCCILFCIRRVMFCEDKRNID